MTDLPYGLIGEKWWELGGDPASFDVPGIAPRTGLLGMPLAPEHGVPNPAQLSPRIQRFEHGVIAWCPAQGGRMLVWGVNVIYHANPIGAAGSPLAPYWVYRKNAANDPLPGGQPSVLFEWGPTDPFHYERFIVRWHVAPDTAWHQSDVDNGSPNRGLFGPVGWPPPGVEYGTSHASVEFIVEGYDGEARQGWTIPVSVDIF